MCRWQLPCRLIMQIGSHHQAVHVSSRVLLPSRFRHAPCLSGGHQQQQPGGPDERKPVFTLSPGIQLRKCERVADPVPTRIDIRYGRGAFM